MSFDRWPEGERALRAPDEVKSNARINQLREQHNSKLEHASVSLSEYSLPRITDPFTCLSVSCMSRSELTDSP